MKNEKKYLFLFFFLSFSFCEIMSNRLEEISNLSDASDHEEDWQDAETEQQQQPTEQVKERKVEIDESSLRKKIKEIQEDSSLSPKDKAKRIQVNDVVCGLYINIEQLAYIKIEFDVSWDN